MAEKPYLSLHGNDAGQMVGLRNVITGEGDLEIAAQDPEETSHGPTQGPTPHSDSNFDRPGDEWGTFFRFPTSGCWQVIARRGATRATLTVRVVD